MYLPPNSTAILLKADVSWPYYVWDGSSKSYTLDFQLKIDTNVVHQFTYNGFTSGGSGSFSLTTNLNIKPFGMTNGFATFAVDVTKRNYGSINGAVQIQSGTCNLWIVDKK